MYWVPRGMVRAPEFDVAEAEEQAPGITSSSISTSWVCKIGVPVNNSN